MQDADFRTFPTPAEETLLLQEVSSFSERVAKVSIIAALEANDVDRTARFPKAAIDAARHQKLLGVQVPRKFGGDGASISDVADMCYRLGRSCASTAMIFAMHQTKMACLVRQGVGGPWVEGFIRRVAAEQLLLASSTTVGQAGGNIRSSTAPVERTSKGISLVRSGTVISYG